MSEPPCRWGWEMHAAYLPSGETKYWGTWVCGCGRRGTVDVRDRNMFRVERKITRYWEQHAARVWRKRRDGQGPSHTRSQAEARRTKQASQATTTTSRLLGLNR